MAIHCLSPTQAMTERTRSRACGTIGMVLIMSHLGILEARTAWGLVHTRAVRTTWATEFTDTTIPSGLPTGLGARTRRMTIISDGRWTFRLEGIMRKLTVGMVAYDDFDGVYFTIQAIRMFHPEALPDIEFLVVDNNPGSPHGQAIRDFIYSTGRTSQYIPFESYKSTSVRELVFTHARGGYVLCMDCHVMCVPGSLKRLLDYFDSGADNGNLLQGPLLYDDLSHISTHFEPIWRENMWGIWATDERGRDPDAAPFEIPMQGLGCFASRKDAWLGFSPHFRGFGGEEGYIHEKFRKAGKKTLCLPFLRWVHRFGRPNGASYPLNMGDRVLNYMIGHMELGMDCRPICDHFSGSYTENDLNRMMEFAHTTLYGQNSVTSQTG